jgi:hypothetical protein
VRAWGVRPRADVPRIREGHFTHPCRPRFEMCSRAL